MKKITPLLTTIPAFLLGLFWYSPYFLGNLWLAYKGFSLEGVKTSSMVVPSILSFLLMVLMAYGLRWLMAKAKVPATYQAGLQFGLMLSLFFILTSLGIIYVYSGSPHFLALWAIDAAYQATFITMMATILAVF